MFGVVDKRMTASVCDNIVGMLSDNREEDNFTFFFHIALGSALMHPERTEYIARVCRKICLAVPNYPSIRRNNAATRLVRTEKMLVDRLARKFSGIKKVFNTQEWREVLARMEEGNAPAAIVAMLSNKFRKDVVKSLRNFLTLRSFAEELRRHGVGLEGGGITALEYRMNAFMRKKSIIQFLNDIHNRVARGEVAPPVATKAKPETKTFKTLILKKSRTISSDQTKEGDRGGGKGEFDIDGAIERGEAAPAATTEPEPETKTLKTLIIGKSKKISSKQTKEGDLGGGREFDIDGAITGGGTAPEATTKPQPETKTLNTLIIKKSKTISGDETKEGDLGGGEGECDIEGTIARGEAAPAATTKPEPETKTLKTLIIRKSKTISSDQTKEGDRGGGKGELDIDGAIEQGEPAPAATTKPEPETKTLKTIIIKKSKKINSDETKEGDLGGGGGGGEFHIEGTIARGEAGPAATTKPEPETKTLKTLIIKKSKKLTAMRPKKEILEEEEEESLILTEPSPSPSAKKWSDNHEVLDKSASAFSDEYEMLR